MSRTWVACLLSLFLGSHAVGEIQINEIYFAENDENEFVELRSDTGGVESLDDIWLLQFAATYDSESSGELVSALDFSGFSTGQNGLFLWHAPITNEELRSPLPLPESQTTTHYGEFNGILDDQLVLMLVKGFRGSLALDLDLDNDQSIDDENDLPWADVIQQHSRIDRAYVGRVRNGEPAQDYSVGLDLNDADDSRGYFWGESSVEAAIINSNALEDGYYIYGTQEQENLEALEPILLDKSEFSSTVRLTSPVTVSSIRQLTPGRDNFYHANLLADCNKDEFIDLDDIECAAEAGVLSDLLIHTGHLEGDFNFDRKVDFSDFLVLSNNFGKDLVIYEEGDANGDGIINFGDFLLLANNFDSLEVGAAVPEPTSCALLHVVLCGLCLRVLKRRHRERSAHEVEAKLWTAT